MLGQGHADPQKRDSLGTCAHDTVQPERDPVVRLLDRVFELSVDAAEADDQSVGLAPGRVGRVGLAVDLYVGERRFSICAQQ